MAVVSTAAPAVTSTLPNEIEVVLAVQVGEPAFALSGNTTPNSQSASPGSTNRRISVAPSRPGGKPLAVPLVCIVGLALPLDSGQRYDRMVNIG